MSFIAGAMLDRYGIWSVLALNLVLMTPSVFLSLHLWRPKGKADEAEPEGGKRGGLDLRFPTVSDLMEMVSPSGGAVGPRGAVMRDTEGSSSVAAGLQAELAHRKPAMAWTDGDERAEDDGHLEGGCGGGSGSGCRALLSVPAADDLPFAVKLRLIFSRPESLMFFLTAIVMGIGFGLIESYLFLMLKELGATDLLLGKPLGAQLTRSKTE